MSLPTPEAGLVISYSYLWHHEHQAGQEDGRKNRPSVIVLAVECETDGPLLVTVLPVTHRSPKVAETGIEIPAVIKRHLGLDDARSWIVVDEGNEFVWPGYDLQKVPGADRYDYGFLPPRFFKQVQEAFLTWRRGGKRPLTKRD